MMFAEPRIASGPARRRWIVWTWAALGSLAVNLVLFALMPYLLHRFEDRPSFEKLIPQINVIRLKRPEPPVERKAPRRPEAVKAKIAPPPPPAASGRVPPADLKLAFDINPRLSGGPAVAVPPPMQVTAFDYSAVPSMVAADELDHPLTVLSRMPPVYPMGAKRRGIQGWVKVRVVVDARGGVEDVEVIEARPPGVFDESVIRSVRGWRFKPGTVGGVPVRAQAQTTVRFELE